MTTSRNQPIDRQESLKAETVSYEVALDRIKKLTKDTPESGPKDSLKLAIRQCQDMAKDDATSTECGEGGVSIPMMAQESLEKLFALLKENRICAALTLVYEKGIESGVKRGIRMASGKDPNADNAISFSFGGLNHFLVEAEVRKIPRAQMFRWLRKGGRFCVGKMSYFVDLPPFSKKKAENMLLGWRYRKGRKAYAPNTARMT